MCASPEPRHDTLKCIAPRSVRYSQRIAAETHERQGRSHASSRYLSGLSSARRQRECTDGAVTAMS